MKVSENFDAVEDLKKVRAESEAARRQHLENFEILNEKDLMERVSALLARVGR